MDGCQNSVEQDAVAPFYERQLDRLGHWKARIAQIPWAVAWVAIRIRGSMGQCLHIQHGQAMNSITSIMS